MKSYQKETKITRGYLEAWLANRKDEILASWIALNENEEVIKIRGIEV